ncbi:MAG: RNA methyltransferase [Clostridium sp.]
MITSTGNTQVKEIANLVKKAKARREQGLFIVEGIKMFSELPMDHLEKTYVSESFLAQHRSETENRLEQLAGSHVECVSDEVMRYMSDTQTPQGILAVARQFSYTVEDIIKQDPNVPAHLIVLETIQDPGNLGTILRAGEGAGITGVIMSHDTADIYSPKVIRSTMGSIYRVPFVYTDDLKHTITEIKKAEICLYAAHLKGKNNYEEEDYRGNIGFLIGNEANGLSGAISAMADCYVKIPMAGSVESLNAAVAASVLMFETARQRRKNW